MKDSYERGQRGVIISHLTSFLFSLCTHVLTGRTGSYVPVVANFFEKKRAKLLRFKKGYLYFSVILTGAVR